MVYADWPSVITVSIPAHHSGNRLASCSSFHTSSNGASTVMMRVKSGINASSHVGDQSPHDLPPIEEFGAPD
jgi:hypothetical protein